MKIILLIFVFNSLNKALTQVNEQLENSKIYSNQDVKEQIENLRNRRAVHYDTYEFPSTQNHLTVSNDSYKKKGDTLKGYEIIKLTANENPFTLPNNKPNHNTRYSSIDIRNQIGRSLSGSSYNFDSPQHSNNNFSNRNFIKSPTPSIDIRFGDDEENGEYKKIDHLANGKTIQNEQSAETYQYQFNKGWSVHEAISVDDITIPRLEQQKGSKFSIPNAPESHYYEKFYDIYNHVEHQTKQDLGQFEKESINDDFNGRSIVAPGQYPHMAAIGFLSNEEKIEFKCGGSLISETFVITAAHCCYLNGEKPIIVKLGIINLKSQIGNSDPQRRAIKEIIVHPSYNSTMNYHDIALLKLQSPVEFTKFVLPILLWSSDDIPYQRVFTMGYGSTSFAKAPTNILTELSLSLIPLQQCKEIMPRDEKAPDGILESQICGRDLEKNRDTCQGDSGGPLQLNLEHRQQRNTYRYYLVGIISYGEFCGSKKPGVYTRVSSYCKWIASLVWPNFKS